MNKEALIHEICRTLLYLLWWGLEFEEGSANWTNLLISYSLIGIFIIMFHSWKLEGASTPLIEPGVFMHMFLRQSTAAFKCNKTSEKSKISLISGYTPRQKPLFCLSFWHQPFIGAMHIYLYSFGISWHGEICLSWVFYYCEWFVYSPYQSMPHEYT